MMNKPKISIAVPCYDMYGTGRDKLKTLLSTLKTQTFKDFNVVISDQSTTSDIEELVEIEKTDLDIIYVRDNANEKISPMSSNINNSIYNSSGEIIKILFQDDMLLGNDSLFLLNQKFDYSKKWFVSSYIYKTQDNINITQVPRLTEPIKLHNKNTGVLFGGLVIGTPSCLSILNEYPLFFDENLSYFVDVEYYFRLYMKYGPPYILNVNTMLQILWESNTSTIMYNNHKDIIEKEKEYIIEKYKEIFKENEYTR